MTIDGGPSIKGPESIWIESGYTRGTSYSSMSHKCGMNMAYRALTDGGPTKDHTFWHLAQNLVLIQ